MTDDTRKKKRGRSKVFRSCFRSSAAADGPFSYENSHDRDSKEERLGKPVLIAVSGRKGKDFISDVNLVNGDVADSGVDGFAKQSSSSRPRIFRVVKAFLFAASMSKKIRKVSSKSSIASDTSLSSLSSEKTGKSFNRSNLCGRECTDIDDSCSRRSNILSSSVFSTSCSSSTNSNSRSLSDQKTSSRLDLLDFKHPVSFNSLSSTKANPINSSSRSSSDPKGSSLIDSFDSRNLFTSNSLSLTKLIPAKIKSDGSNLNIRLWLFLLLSLFVLVIWGRIFSILCTSIWFYVVPCRRIKRVNSVTNAVESVDTDSEQYKKRAIMAGLLGRSCNTFW